MTIKSFIERHQITMTSERAGSNPSNPEWKDANHWRCILALGKRRMVVHFSKGYGHKGAEPTAAEVLDCLALDASGVQGMSFGDWAAEYGYDTDSRKAERLYRATRKQGGQLAHFLGAADYDFLLDSVERL